MKFCDNGEVVRVQAHVGLEKGTRASMTRYALRVRAEDSIFR